MPYDAKAEARTGLVDHLKSQVLFYQVQLERIRTSRPARSRSEFQTLERLEAYSAAAIEAHLDILAAIEAGNVWAENNSHEMKKGD